ncbi:hypothetical protein MCOR25_010590 [Pyricularia grisea]|nr:hypothetical protein MCOR25_010590 [Pyricularia grisea]
MSITRNVYMPPSIHEIMYAMLKGDDGKSFRTSGPIPKMRLLERYLTSTICLTIQVKGELAKSDNSNERLAVVQLGAYKLLFAFADKLKLGLRLTN